jgi:hypothetical protein
MVSTNLQDTTLTLLQVFPKDPEAREESILRRSLS